MEELWSSVFTEENLTTPSASVYLERTTTEVSLFNDTSSENGTFESLLSRGSTFPTPTLKDQVFVILSCLFYGTSFILGALGNGLIIYIVAHYSRMRSLCNVFLASLATADFLLVCLCIPVKLVQLMTYTWTLGEFTCKMLHYMQNVSAFCSVLTLTTMSIERYYAILHPVECRTTFSMHHIQKIIVLIWTLALLMASPAIFIYIQVPVGDPANFGGHQYWYCIKKSAEWAHYSNASSELESSWSQWRQVYELYMLMTILIVPALIMTFTYWRICTHLWSIVHRRTAIRFGHTCHVISKGGKVSKTSTAVILTTTTEGKTTSQATVLTKPSPPTGKSSAASSTSASSASTVSTNSSTAGLHLECRRSIEEDNQTVKQVIKMLVAVVALFILCWTPMLLVNVLKAFKVIQDMNHDWVKELVSVSYFMAYLNSVLNPFIYGFMSKNFRLYIKTICTQMVSYTLCTQDSPGTFGSTKSDVSKQTRLSRTPPAAAFVVRVDRPETAGEKNKCPLKDMAASGLLPMATRKTSDPKTECVSVNDTWPAQSSPTVMTVVQPLTPL